MTSQLTVRDIQFSATYEPEKIRRLMENLRRVVAAVNSLVDQVNTLVEASGASISEHVLATTSGLGESHSVSGLTAGQVLKATSANSAAFGVLSFTDLAGVDTDTFDLVENGDVLQFIDGYYTMAPFTASSSMALDGYYLLSAAHASLSNGRVGQASSTISLDFSTAGQFSASVKAGSITSAHLDRVYSRDFMLMGG